MYGFTIIFNKTDLIDFFLTQEATWYFKVSELNSTRVT